jgi:DNA repair exonuclease SbcCD ATPase subunit
MAANQTIYVEHQPKIIKQIDIIILIVNGLYKMLYFTHNTKIDNELLDRVIMAINQELTDGDIEKINRALKSVAQYIQWQLKTSQAWSIEILDNLKQIEQEFHKNSAHFFQLLQVHDLLPTDEKILNQRLSNSLFDTISYKEKQLNNHLLQLQSRYNMLKKQYSTLITKEKDTQNNENKAQKANNSPDSMKVIQNHENDIRKTDHTTWHTHNTQCENQITKIIELSQKYKKSIDSLFNFENVNKQHLEQLSELQREIESFLQLPIVDCEHINNIKKDLSIIPQRLDDFVKKCHHIYNVLSKSSQLAKEIHKMKIEYVKYIECRYNCENIQQENHFFTHLNDECQSNIKMISDYIERKNYINDEIKDVKERITVLEKEIQHLQHLQK